MMKKPVITLTLKDSIKEAIDLMKKHKIGSIVIIDADNLPVNIITTKDIINLFDTDYKIDSSLKISSLPIKPNLITIFDNDSFDDAIGLLTTNLIHHLIVINYSGSVVGILSTQDILNTQKLFDRFFPYFPNAQMVQ